MFRTPTLTTEGRAPSYLQLALTLLSEWVRELLEPDVLRYQDATVERLRLRSGETATTVLRRLENGRVEVATVYVADWLPAKVAEADSRAAAQRARSVDHWQETLRTLQGEVLRQARQHPRDWGWVYWSAPQALRSWVDAEVRRTDITERAAHRVWAFLTLRVAALAELEQSELSADQRLQLYLVGGLNAPVEVEPREDRAGGATTFVRGRGVVKDGKVVRKVNKKRSPARKADELAKAQRKLARATTPEARRAARQALARLQYRWQPRVDADGIVLPRMLQH